MQLRLTPLEEVFLSVARKAELEHAQVCATTLLGGGAVEGVGGGGGGLHEQVPAGSVHTPSLA